MKILLFGANGQVGWELQRALAPLGELTALGRQGQGSLCGDLARPDGLRQTIRTVQPDAIVSAAAYTAVDKAESEQEQVERINAQAPGVLAEEAQRQNASLVHYSTDYVFDGSGTTPWREDDKPAPLNVYGKTKLEGEQLIRYNCGRHLIFRTQWVYAARGSNFIRTMLRLAMERDSLRIIDDQYGAPTGAALIADVTAHAIRGISDNAQRAGTYHLAANGETSWHGYARFVINTARQSGLPVKVAYDAIMPVDSAAFRTPARRPHNSRMSTVRLEQEFGLTMPCWKSGVAHVLSEIIGSSDS